VHSLRCSDLEIVWADSDSGLSFLDVFFYTYLGESGVCFRPFEKALNYY
jgi:hypothetical protein